MTSGRSIDHIVITVPDLDNASAAFISAGFTLTPRAQHENRMGTSNRLAQFSERNFIEILEVDRPRGIDPHRFDDVPPKFSFGAHNHEFIETGEGVSMIVFQSEDAIADCESFTKKGLQTYAPFAFDRSGQLPDGSKVTLSFKLTFVTSPTLPGLAFFVCENQAQEAFWKPEYQSHENGASGIEQIHIRAKEPEKAANFVGQLFDGRVDNHGDCFSVQCGASQEIVVTPQDYLDARFEDAVSSITEDTVVPGMAIGTRGNGQTLGLHGVALHLM